MHAIGWIEVPVTQMDRAMKFYNSVFGWELREMDLGPLSMAIFPGSHGETGAGGALVQNESYTPGIQGVLPYFNCDDVAVQADRVVGAGGRLLRGKTQISPDFGYMALAIDTEGNRIAFHSRK